MKEVKKIELKHSDGWVFHHINEIEELLDEYGMGSLVIEDGKMFFLYDDAENVQEYLDYLFPNPIIRENGDRFYVCGYWVPCSFDILWKPSEQVGYSCDFKFKTLKDFRVFEREIYRYKRQSKKNLEARNVSGGDFGEYIFLNVAKFALSYCDYTTEEIEKIKGYWKL